MNTSATFKRVNEALVAALPELKPKYVAETEAWGEEMGPHVIYADILCPFLSDTLRGGGPESDEVLRRAFALLEDLAAESNEEIRSVATTTVAEHLESDLEALRRAVDYMGPRMAAAVRPPQN